MSRQDIARLERDEPERLERRAELYSQQGREADAARKIGFVMLACDARRYAANLRAMRAARLRNDMV